MLLRGCRSVRSAGPKTSRARITDSDWLNRPPEGTEAMHMVAWFHRGYLMPACKLGSKQHSTPLGCRTRMQWQRAHECASQQVSY
jgi:hypothetical protein